MKKNKIFINDKLRLPITNSCNFSCFYCHNEGQSHNQNISYMSLNFIKSLKNFILKNNIFIDEINITGGEPLLHPDILNIVQLLKNLSNELSIITNGSLLTKEKIDLLIESGITKFKFGVDCLSKNQSKLNIHPVKSNTKNLLDLIKYAQSKLKNTQINVVVTKENLNELDKFVKFATENNIYCINFIELINCGFRSKDLIRKYTPKIECVLKILNKDSVKILRNDANRIILKYKNLLIKLSKDFCKNKTCYNTYTVLHENKLVLCHKNHITLDFDINKIALVELKASIKHFVCPEL